MNDLDLETAWRIFENINGWIRFSDAKATALLIANGVVVGFLTLAAPLGPWWITAAAVATLIFAAVSIGYAAACLNPTLTIGQSDSIMYFGHIAKRLHPQATPEETKRIRAEFDRDFTKVLTDPDAAARGIRGQVWANSRIAWKKYRNVSLSGRWFFAALAAGALFALLAVLTPS